MSDYDASEAHEAMALIEALRKLPCNSIHYFGQGVCGSCYANVHDGLAKAIHVIRASARAEAFEEAAKVADAALAKWDANCSRPQSEHSGPSYAAAVGGASAAKDIAAAIRALAKEAAE